MNQPFYADCNWLQNLLCLAIGRDDLGQVGQALYENEAVVYGKLEGGCYDVAYENRYLANVGWCGVNSSGGRIGKMKNQCHRN